MKQMNEFKQIRLVSYILPGQVNNPQKIKDIIKNAILQYQRFHPISGIRRSLLFGKSSNIQDQPDLQESPQYVVKFTCHNHRNIQNFFYISQTNKSEQILEYIKNHYKCSNVSTFGVYQVSSMLIYQMKFNGANCWGIFIRPIESYTAHSLSTFLINTLRQNNQNRDFRIKMSNYEIGE